MKCRLRKSLVAKDSEIVQLKDQIKALETQAITTDSELKAYTNVIDSQKVKISQLEMEREKDVGFCCFVSVPELILP